jgi:hypothetical protein
LQGALAGQLGNQLAQQLATGEEIEVYRQVWSIVGSVRYL